MEQLILSPPIVFIILLLCGVFFSLMVSYLAPRSIPTEERMSLICGQRNVDHMVSPDYEQFFPFAFFFTIMHVLVLVVATAPKDSITLPLIYVGAGILSLLILFREVANG